VTGGAGFIGRHLVEALVARGGSVRVLDLGAPGPLAGRIEHIRGSILDPGTLARAVAGADCVYHLAAVPHLWLRDRGEFDRVNRRGTEAVLGAAAEEGVARVVHCSTESILLGERRSGRPIDESVPPPGLAEMPGPYTRSKHLAERAALEAARRGLPVVIANPTVPIGPGDDNMTPPAAMLRTFLRSPPPFYLDCMLNLVDVRDVALGLMLAAERGRPGERYILGGENVPFGELLERIAAATGARMPKARIPGALALTFAAAAELAADRVTHRAPAATREGVRLALRSAPLESGKARRDLGYAPRPVEEALRSSIAWLSAAKIGSHEFA